MKTESISKRKDEVFDVQLSSSPSSGFVWKLATLPPGIELVEKTITPGDKDGSAGAPSSDLYRFKGTQPGDYQLNFNLGRSWEDRVIDEIVYKVTIT